MNDAIQAIFDEHDIRPDQVVVNQGIGGSRTAFQVMEAAIQGALDEIEENEE